MKGWMGHDHEKKTGKGWSGALGLKDGMVSHLKDGLFSKSSKSTLPVEEDERLLKLEKEKRELREVILIWQDCILRNLKLGWNLTIP